MAKTKTKKSDENREFFVPGTEKREIFTLVLEIVSDLIKEGKIDLDVNSRYQPELNMNPTEIEDFVTKRSEKDISFKKFLSICSTEIETLLMASFYCDKTKGIQNSIPSPIVSEVGLSEFLWRLEETNKAIPVPKIIKNKIIFNETAKGALLKEIKWEKNCKKFDSSFGELDDFEYATLSIIYSQPATERQKSRLLGEGLSVEIPTTNEPKQLTLELQKKDISNLIDNLQQILETL